MDAEKVKDINDTRCFLNVDCIDDGGKFGQMPACGTIVAI